MNTGILAYSINFTVFTLPSNFISKKIGAHRWIPILMSSWAIVTWAHVLIDVSRSLSVHTILSTSLVRVREITYI